MVTRALLVLLLVVMLALLLACAGAAAAAARAVPTVTGGAVGHHVAEFQEYSRRMKNAGYDMEQYNQFIARAAAAAP